MEETRSAEEAAIRAAVVSFYEAIEALICGRGMGPMRDAWEHTPAVTASHPMGTWSYGWDEILATWEVLVIIGAPENGGSSVRDLHVRYYGGDLAYATCTFVASPKFGGSALNCTDILHRDGGVWRIVHHHVDKSPTLEQNLVKAAEG